MSRTNNNFSESPKPSPKEVFNQALELPQEQRGEFVHRACGDDRELLERVSRLLRAYEDAPDFLNLLGDIPAATSLPPITTASTSEPVGHAGERIGRYKLLQSIGEGGFGEVWMAEQLQPIKRRVALKIIKLGMDTKQVIARFEAERQALAMMDHPNIARVLDGGATESGRPYFVMELVTGDPITDYADQNHLTINERLDLFAQVCQAVQHAHTKGIIHRDIKPGNVLVSTQDGRPLAKVIDFGIAKATNATLTEKTLFTEHRQMIGTPEYMSPEQASGSLDIDTRTDVYSLGVMLYELLSGAPPFDPKELRSAAYAEIQRIIREVEPPKPSTRVSRDVNTLKQTAAQRRIDPQKLGGALRGELDWIVMKCLDKDRARRYETASAVAIDIARHRGGEPVLAAPPSAAYRIKKFVRKHRGPVAVSLTAVILLTLGIVGTSIGLHEARKSRASLKDQFDLLKSGVGDVAVQSLDWLGEKESHTKFFAHDGGTVEVLAGSDEQGPTRVYAYGPTGKEEDSGRALVEWLYARASDAMSDAKRANAELKQERDAAVKLKDAAELEAYVGNLFAASAALNGGDLLTMRARLAACPERLRNWEWNYLNAQQDQSLLVLKPQDANIISASLSDDATRIVSACDDTTARIWDTATGQELHVLRGHTKDVRSAVISPDGLRVVTASDDKTARVWDVATGRELFHLVGHEAELTCAAFSPDGKRIVTAARDATARVWDADGKQLHILRGHEADPVDIATFSPDGSRILTAGWDNTARIWDASSGKLLATLGESHRLAREADGMFRVQFSELLRIAAFSSDGSRIMTYSGGAGAQVWRASDGSLIATMENTADDKMNVVEVRQNELTIWVSQEASAVCNADGSQVIARSQVAEGLSVFDVQTGKRLQSLGGTKGVPWPEALSFCAASNRLVGGCSGVIRIWDVAAGKQLASHRGHAGPVQSIAISKDERLLVTVGDDGTARIWDAEQFPEPVLTGDEKLKTWLPVSIRFRGDAGTTTLVDKLASRAEDDPDKEPTSFHRRVGDADALFTKEQVVLSPDGSRMATRGDGVTARVWEVATGKLVSVLGTPVQKATDEGPAKDDLKISVPPGYWVRGVRWVRQIAFSPDGSRIATALDDKTARVWDAATGKEQLVLRGHEEGLNCVAFSADGAVIATGSSDHAARLWDAKAGTSLQVLTGHKDDLHWVEFAPDGSAIVTASKDGTARIWDVKSGKQRRVLDHNGAAIIAARFSPDGQRIITLIRRPSGTNVRVWDTESGKELLSTPLSIPSDTGWTQIAFSRDGSRLVAGGFGEISALDSVPYRQRYALRQQSSTQPADRGQRP